MLKEFIAHIQDTTLPRVEKIGDETYCIANDGTVTQIRPELDYPDELRLNSLDALVNLVKTEALSLYKKPLYITVPSYDTVECFTNAEEMKRWNRSHLYQAAATDVPGWPEKTQLGFEEAQIALRARFQETPDVQYAMKLLSNISCGAKVVYNDNGIATTVTTQKGVALQTSEQIRSLLKLRPYRTFQEVEQPESIFLIRLNDRGISFIAADGGMWKLTARKTVKKFLEAALQSEVEKSEVVICL